MKNGRFQVGIIGCGGIAYWHCFSYAGMDDVDVVALCDIVPGKPEHYKNTFHFDKARIYYNHIEMLENEELDAVSVCTYNTQHAPCTIDALNHGVNVLVEKPMSATFEEAVEMMRAEKKSGKIISVGFQSRFHESMIFTKEVVRSGVLGDIYYIQTGGGRRRGIPGGSFVRKDTAGVGSVGDIGCYSLDLVLDAIGYPKPLSVSAYTSDFFGKDKAEVGEEIASTFGVDDFAAAFIRLEGGIVIDFKISWAMNIDSPCDTVILGKKAGLRIPATGCWNSGVGGDLTLYRGENEQETLYLPHPAKETFDLLFPCKVRSFLEAVRDNKPAPVPTSQILYNQAIINGIVDSARLGREVEIIIPEI